MAAMALKKQQKIFVKLGLKQVLEHLFMQGSDYQKSDTMIGNKTIFCSFLFLQMYSFRWKNFMKENDAADMDKQDFNCWIT